MIEAADVRSEVVEAFVNPVKRPWHPHTFYEVDHSATEGGEAGPVFDLGTSSCS